MKSNFALLLAMLVVSAIIAGSTNAAVPLLLSHQGRLLDAGDQPVTGTRDITFHIYETETGGVPLWSEPHNDVPIDNGLFHVTLGGTITVSGDLLVTSGTLQTERWLELQVEGETLTPRLRLGSTPYAVGASRVSGDVETSLGQLSLSGMSGSTTATIRSSSNPGDPGSEVELVDGSGSTTGTIRASSATGSELSLGYVGGMSGSTTATIRSGGGGGGGGGADPTHSELLLDTDSDGDLITDFESSLSTSSSGVEHRFIWNSAADLGSEPNQKVVLKVTPTDAAEEIIADVDGDGHAERRFGTIVSPVQAATGVGADLNDDGLDDIEVSSKTTALGSTLSVSAGTLDVSGKYKLYSVTGQPTPVGESMSSRMAVGDNVDRIDDRMVLDSVGPSQALRLTAADLTGDGVPDVAVSDRATAAGAVTRLTGMSGSTTGTIRMAATPDSTKVECTSDLDGDGIAQGKYKLQSGFIYSSQQIAFDSDDDGVDEGSLEEISDAGGARSTFIGRSGSTTATIRMQADPDSSKIECDSDDDGDGIARAKGIILCKPGGATGSASGIFSFDTDDDGVADNSVEQVSNSSKAYLAIKTKGTGAQRTTILSEASDSGIFDISVDDDGDGHLGAKLTFRALDQVSEPLTATYLEVDDNDDGVIDNSLRSTCDSGSSQLAILAGVAVPKFIDITARETGPVPGGTSDVSISMGVDSADTAIDIRADGTVVRFRLMDSSSDRVDLEVDGSSSHISVVPPTAGVYQFELVVTDASSNLTMKNGSGLVALDMNGDGRIGIGGAAHATNPVHHSSGAHLTVGGTWTNASDKNAKENFSAVDGEELLEKIEELPITKWNYKNEDESITHIGPTAQDFKAAFGVGSDDKSISTVDPSGIALAAIKELIKQNQELLKANEELNKRVKALEKKQQNQ